MLFGVGVMQVLVTAPGGIAGDLEKLGRLIKRKVVVRRGADDGGRRLIEISNLTVRFGGVTPIDDMNLTFGSAPTA